MEPAKKIPVPKKFEPFGHTRMHKDADKGPPLDKLREGATLSDLTKEYALFTHAPLAVGGGLMVNIVREYLNKVGVTEGVYKIPLPTPVFSLNLLPGGEVWERTLFACELPLWEGPEPGDGLCYHVATAGMVNRQHRYFARVLTQDVPVADVLAILKTSVLRLPCPSVMVTTFSIDSNRGVLAFEPATNMPVDRPRLVEKPPLARTLALAAAELGGAKRPYDKAEQILREQDRQRRERGRE